MDPRPGHDRADSTRTTEPRLPIMKATSHEPTKRGAVGSQTRWAGTGGNWCKAMIRSVGKGRGAVAAPRWITLAAVMSSLGAIPQASPADVLHMSTGETMEAEILDDKGDHYRARTLLGIVNVEKDRVARIEKKTSPWRRYRAKRRRCPDDAAGHLRLAQWCERQGLGPERLDELEMVIALDPDNAEARTALGYVRSENGKWGRPTSTNALPPEEQEARRRQREEEKLLADLISEWFVKIKAIHRGRMASGKGGAGSAKFRKGRGQILAIRDPLALPALTGVLSSGNVACRLVLVEALSRFDEDEATMNLLVMTLLDPSSRVRKAAASALVPREDERVISRLRVALKNKDESILRRAATALGALKAHSAVEDLIEVLSTYRRRSVEVTRAVFFGGIYSNFCGYARIVHRRGLLRYHPGSIGVLGSYGLVGTYSDVEIQTVANHRTEVQEALIAITGENFGFDRDAWHAWSAGARQR